MQLITFKIDANLDRMWKLIGIVEDERENEVQKLYNTLVSAYQSFVENVSRTCEELRGELMETQEEFKRVQKKYADNSTVLPVKPNLSYKKQIKLARKAIEKIQENYEPRVQEFYTVHSQLIELFNKLGIPNEERDDFSEVGDSDLTEQRLKLFKDRLQIMKVEFQQRTTIVKSYHHSLLDLGEELDEPLPNHVIEIFQKELHDNESVQILIDAQTELQKLKEERLNQIEGLIQKIDYYYDVLGIDTSDQMVKSTAPTAKTIEDYENEVQFLMETSKTRFPIVIKELNKSISKLCDEMSIPLRQRPHFNGTNIEKQAVFLKEELENLKQRQIQNRPLLNLISELETQRGYLKASPTVGTRKSPTIRKNAELDRFKRNAKEQIPKLEEKLYKLLIEYRKQNGQDFYFNETRVIDTIDPEKFTEESKAAAAGKKLLFQKMNEAANNNNNNSTFMKTPTRGKPLKLSTYTLSPFK